MALSPVLATCGACGITGEERPGTASTATSLDGSNNTTSASNGPRAVSTVTLVVPATTCAFVITRSGAITKPEPSSARWQLGATPRMRSTLCCSEAATGLASTLGSGGSTAVIGGLPNGPITSGRPEVLSNRENSLGTRRSQFGA